MAFIAEYGHTSALMVPSGSHPGSIASCLCKLLVLCGWNVFESLRLIKAANAIAEFVGMWLKSLQEDRQHFNREEEPGEEGHEEAEKA